MFRILSRIALSVAVVAVLVTANIAQASQIRSSAERHQRPGHSFFVHSTCVRLSR